VGLFKQKLQFLSNDKFKVDKVYGPQFFNCHSVAVATDSVPD